MLTPARNSDVKHGFDLPEVFVQHSTQIGKALVIGRGKRKLDGLGFQPKSSSCSGLTMKVKVKCCKRCMWIIAINQKMSGQLLDLGSKARQVIVQWRCPNSGSDGRGLQ